MAEENDKHSSVNETFAIDQRAIKVFLDWLPDNWLPRKQDPDFFVDYLVEMVDQGEPTGLHFAAQVKGFEEDPNSPKPLSYSFKTKHLRYYLHRSQHPVFLFLINVTSREGFWVFAQKRLRENVPSRDLDTQRSSTIHFAAEDNLLNFTKFKCLFQEAQQYVRNLHPGSVQAALVKRRAELESKDPRCSVSISVQDGKERISVIPKEDFSFSLKVHSHNVEGWRNFFERGSKLKLAPGEVEIEGAPLLENLIKSRDDALAIQLGPAHPAALHVVCAAGGGTKVVPIEGCMRAGTKYLTFEGALPNSPLSIAFEISFEAVQKGEMFQSEILYSPSNWVGQNILWLAHFDQIKVFADAFVGGVAPKAEIYVRGNSLVVCDLNGADKELMQQMSDSMEWFRRCRWVASHYQINPPLPTLSTLTKGQMEDVDVLFDLLSTQETTSPAPYAELAFTTETVPPEGAAIGDDNFLSDGSLRFTMRGKEIDFLGIPIQLDAFRCLLTEMECISRSVLKDGTMEFVYRGTAETRQTLALLRC